MSIWGRGQAAKDGVRITLWLRRGLQIIRVIKPDLRASHEITAGRALGAWQGAAEPISGLLEAIPGGVSGAGRLQPGVQPRDRGLTYSDMSARGCLGPPGTTREVETAPDLWESTAGALCVVLNIEGAVGCPVSVAWGRRACSFPAHGISGGP
ncbi:hypothetical protein NDU88_002871 [Pleurodeles waltl]|uniref:Uncharacterized protein n=1 Tax=Pleurodeles waltl TaxID=8319 RepID=A0AAV7WQS2_PLEWA|nr:hypothetical protein NDU88_002871 [Pleurodeles waltl]